MGWDYHHETAPYDKRAICRKHISSGYEVVKDAVVGSVYYGAIRCKATGEVGCLVVLIHIARNDYCNFGMKWMGETCEPYYYDCPKSVLDALSPTDNEYAKRWREKCRQRLREKKENVLGKAPVGATLKVHLKDGTTLTVEKMAPTGGQFKRWWLLVKGGCTYVPVQRVEKAELL